jgi:hypothetical protein
MTFQILSLHFATRGIAPRGFLAARRKPGNWRCLWRRLADAFDQSHQRAIDREVAAYLNVRGGRFTDSVERDIERMYARSRC